MKSSIVKKNEFVFDILLLCLIASEVVSTSLGEPYYNFTGQTNKFTDIIDNVLNVVEQTTIYFARRVLKVTLEITSALYAPLGIVGIVLYVTKINKYLGKELIYGALLLAFFSQFILPLLL
ncbi:hypothetical protein JHC27_04415 [archaeon]|jgi:hypothetical protein|nr:hypothetical protein [archaeon]